MAVADAGDPNVGRRTLGNALRQGREAAGLTQRQAAAALEWSLSKLIRIEARAQGTSVTDLKAMLDLYGVTDRERVAVLTAAARASRGQSWWVGYRDVISPQFAHFLDHESAASSFRVFHPLLIPGLLHTDLYAAALLGVHPEPERARRIAELRARRQERVLAEPGAEFRFILNEESLHRSVGGPGAMEKQLRHLLDMAGRPRVSIRIVPFSAGAHPGLRGPFILLGLRETGEEVLFQESISGDQLFLDDPGAIAKYSVHFETLTDLALPDEQGKALLEELADRHQRAR